MELGNGEQEKVMAQPTHRPRTWDDFVDISDSEKDRLASLLEQAMYAPKKKRPLFKKEKQSIFISHSKEDLKTLVEPAARRIRSAGFEAYIASLRVTGKNPAEKIVEAIASSRALFAIITRHVSDDRETRDWVLFEIGAARSLGKTVFGWKTRAAAIPEPVKQVTDYFVFDPSTSQGIKQMLQMIGNLARSLASFP